MDTASTPISRRDLLSVDLRGMKAALHAAARAQGVSPSAFVRATLSKAIDLPAFSAIAPRSIAPREPRARLSLRMSRAEAVATLAAARAAGMAPGAYVVGLVAGIPALREGGSMRGHLAALVASTAEVATLRRHLRQLNALLRQGAVDALACREAVDVLTQGLRDHLATVSAIVADLSPRARVAAPIR